MKQHPTQSTLSCMWDVPREDPQIYILFGFVLYILLWFAATASVRHGHGVTTPNEMSRIGESEARSTEEPTWTTAYHNSNLDDKDV